MPLKYWRKTKRIRHGNREARRPPTMPPRRSCLARLRRTLYNLNVSQDRIFLAVFLLIVVVAVYLLVMSILLLTQVHDKLTPWQRSMLAQREMEWAPVYFSQNLSAVTRTVSPLIELPPPPPNPIIKRELKMKTILLWNSFFSNEEYHFGLEQAPFLEHDCPVSMCRTTTNHSEAGTADAIIFHTPEFGQLPAFRPQNQIYIFLQREPHYPKSKQLLNDYQDMFNLTITYRYDSDIVIPYGKVVPRTNSSVRYQEFPPQNKPSMIVWVVSHCNSLGRREMYMDELMRHVDVDVYGDCGNLTCDKSDTSGCLHRFETQYKFYVAMENTYCLDYVSEKLYRSLMYDMIPIVYGKADYTAYSPHHSVIDVLDFPNPKTLAEYLWYLSTNPTQYSRYFEWKKTHDVVYTREEIFAPAFCQLCQVLHDEMFEYKNYRNISSWWLDGTCELGFMSKFRKNHHW